MPPKGLGGRPPDSRIHSYYTRDYQAAPNNPLYRCNACGTDVRGKDPSKLFAHASTCDDIDEPGRADVQEAFEEYQVKREAKRLGTAEGESSGSGTSGNNRKKSGPLDQYMDRKV